MSAAYLTMSHRELDRSEVMHRLLERRLSHRQAAVMLGLSTRQCERLFATPKARQSSAIDSCSPLSFASMKRLRSFIADVTSHGISRSSRGAVQVSPIKPDSPVTHQAGSYKAFYRNVGSPEVGGSRACLPPT